VKDKRATSCATNPFWIAKPILLKTTSIDIGKTTLTFLLFFVLNILSGNHNEQSEIRIHLVENNEYGPMMMAC
jgi:hypothetical protein